MDSKIGVVIPALNEGRNIGWVVRETRGYVPTVLVVDDGSSDDTTAVAEQAGAKVIRHSRCQGKGKSLKDGARQLLDEGCSHIIFMDGDGQHDSADLPKFLRKAGQGCAAVLGNRMDDTDPMPIVRLVTNRVMSSLVSLACRQRVPDSQCGFRMFRADVLEMLLDHCSSNHFDFETEMLLTLSLEGHKIESVDIKTIYADEISSIRPLRDTRRWLALVAGWTITSALGMRGPKPTR